MNHVIALLIFAGGIVYSTCLLVKRHLTSSSFVRTLFLFILAAVFVELFDSAKTITLSFLGQRFEYTRLDSLELKVENITEVLNDLIIQEEIKSADELDKDGNYLLQHVPIRHSVQINTPVLQTEGKDYFVEGNKIIIKHWWKKEKPEDFFAGGPITIKYMRRLEKPSK